jgi:4-amino-4-deoxy-L-arabinose transferase-like glycosyltransferase
MLAGLFAWFAATAWMRPLALPDEGRYVAVALEMLWSGDWLLPTLDGLPYFHKPPLFYWLTGASLAVFGLNEWAARLAPITAATSLAFGLYLFLRRWAAEELARLALLVLATTVFFFGGAQFANLDMLAAATIGGTILFAADAVLAGDAHRPARIGLAAAYIFAALGVLAKGLIGVVIPALVIAAWLALEGRAAMILRLVSLPGFALFASIAAPWFVYVEMHHPGFLDYFFVHHHFERYTTQHFNGHHPFWFYVPVFAVLTLPWCLFLSSAMRRPGAGDVVPQQVHSLMWLWLVVTIVFFSIPASKLPGYVLVAVPPFAVLAATGLARWAKGRGGVGRWAASVAAVAVLLSAMALGGVLAHQQQLITRFGIPDRIDELAAKMRPLLASADEIVFLESYPFSLPFYLRYRRPVRVAEHWDDRRLLEKDTWRRELGDAARFDPARGRSLLMTIDDLRRLLACSHRTMWVVSSRVEGERYPWLKTLERVAASGRHAVWRKTPSPAETQDGGCED